MPRVNLVTVHLSNLVIFLCFASSLADQYHRLPTFDELSNDQKRLLQTLYNGGDPYSGEQYWSSLSMDKKATFFQITYVLEKTKLRSGENLISYVTGLENGKGILEGNKNDHLHFNGTQAEVNGWRIHVLTNGRLTENLLRSERFHKDRLWVDGTHKIFGYEKSFRDYRVATPPHLQLVLDKEEKGSDADIDKGRTRHRSAPRDVYERLAKRYPEIEQIYVVDTKQ